MKRIPFTLAILLTTTLFLASCGGGGVPPVATVPAPAPVPAPQPRPYTVFIPQAGAAVGTGDGTLRGTVYVTPSAEEVTLMNFINEVRVSGTVNGRDATQGSCVEGSFTPLKALTFNGLYAYASRKHAVYVGEVGWEGHNETKTTSPYFYGATVRARIGRAYLEQAKLPESKVEYAEENAQTSDSVASAETALRRWMVSSGHCANIMDAGAQTVGAGYHHTRTEPYAIQGDHSWTMLVGRTEY